jgi:hypothetical protein
LDSSSQFSAGHFGSFGFLTSQIDIVLGESDFDLLRIVRRVHGLNSAGREQIGSRFFGDDGMEARFVSCVTVQKEM